jgi:hypothetical protein
MTTPRPVRTYYSTLADLTRVLFFDHKDATSKDLARTLKLAAEHKATCPTCASWWPGKTPHARCFEAEVYLGTLLDIWRHLPASTRVRQLKLFDGFTLDDGPAVETTTETST